METMQWPREERLGPGGCLVEVPEWATGSARTLFALAVWKLHCGQEDDWENSTGLSENQHCLRERFNPQFPNATKAVTDRSL